MNCPADCQSYVDFFNSSAYSKFPQTHRKGFGNLSYRMIQADMDVLEIVDPRVDDLVLTYSISAQPSTDWSWNFGNGWTTESLRPGRMMTMPPQCESGWRVRGKRRLLVLIVPAATIENTLGDLCPHSLSDAFSPLTKASWSDPLVEVLVNRLWVAAEFGRALDGVLADGALVAVVSQMLQLAGAPTLDAKAIAMSPAKLKRVTEFARSNLDQHLDLTVLANVAGLSVRHFARAFRQETGETPHQWLLGMRTERAKELLCDRSVRLAEIAETCGFSDQSHLTTVLRKATGVTPRQWRERHVNR